MSNDELRRYLIVLRNPIDGADLKYNTRNSSKGALLGEAKTLFSYLSENKSLALARQAVVQDNIFAKRTDQTRKRCWEILHSRYFPHGEGSEYIHPIITLFRTQASETAKQGVLYYHYAISDLFSYEVTVELVYDMFHRGLPNISARNVHEFLDSKVQLHPEINNWTPQTRKSLVSHYLSAIRDFGILEGKVHKKIRRPTVEEELFFYIVTYLRDCGKSPKDILGSDDFRLFLLSPQEVEAKMLETQRKGRIGYRRSGAIISFELPWRSIHEYIENIGQ